MKLHLSVKHENIIQIFGITKEGTGKSQKYVFHNISYFSFLFIQYIYLSLLDEANPIRKYMFVLEYADSGTLNDYLSKNFNVLNWSYKNKLALQLASAVEFIHNCDIIHCDLVMHSIYMIFFILM